MKTYPEPEGRIWTILETVIMTGVVAGMIAAVYFAIYFSRIIIEAR